MNPNSQIVQFSVNGIVYKVVNGFILYNRQVSEKDNEYQY